ncbi:MAG: quinone-dependent dihydroorotate dehydrogenase [Balneolaceae bacterium]
MFYKSFVKPFLFKKDAESAHELAVHLSSITSNSKILTTLANKIYSLNDIRLRKEYFGLHFPNPIGLAAGFDKNGVTPIAMQALGFGFVEIGSITAQPALGNPKPRAFRLPEDRSLINRMGLNNEGAENVIQRLYGLKLDIPLGINIAKTNDASIHGDSAIEDYLLSYNLANQVADYITVNISCPNTGEGKTFEDPDALEALLSGLNISKDSRKPTLVKFSVDTTKHTLEKLVEICESYSIAGYVATNTSSFRENLKTPIGKLQEIGNGGLSGKAISKKSTQVVGWLKEMLKETKPIIGVGGIDNPESAIEKMEAGADLIQIYTGMVYEGPGLVKRIKKGLLAN